MKPGFCEYEDSIAAALLYGRLDASMREHLSACLHCAELEFVCEYFAHLVPPNDEAQPLPAPGPIWWRAQLDEKRERAQRAVAAIELMQKLAICLTLIAIVTFAWFWGGDIPPAYPSSLFIGAAMFLVTGAVLYGWARGRI